MHALFLPIVIVTSMFVYTGYTFAQTSSGSATESPAVSTTSKTTSSKSQLSKSAPKTTTPTKTQTTKTETPTTESKSHRVRKEHGYDHSHSGVGVGIGATFDLGGIGQRRAEPDPFAVGGGQPVSHTEEKPKTPKKPHGTAPTDPFRDVQLTGAQAKEGNNPSGPNNVLEKNR